MKTIFDCIGCIISPFLFFGLLGIIIYIGMRIIEFFEFWSAKETVDKIKGFIKRAEQFIKE